MTVKAKHLHDLAAIRAALQARRRDDTPMRGDVPPLAHRGAAARAAGPTATASEAAGGGATQGTAATPFSLAVGHVLPLRRPAPEPLRGLPPAPWPAQRLRDERAALAESLADPFDVETLLDTDEELSWRRPGIGPDVVRKLRRGVWVVQGECDLHGATREVARQRLGDFLDVARRRGWRCVRIVHGKGLGSPRGQPVLKAKVKRWLAQRADVLAYAHARGIDGGHGALIVLLREASPKPPRPALSIVS